LLTEEEATLVKPTHDQIIGALVNEVFDLAGWQWNDAA
jgi:hypothetical protein